jgi:hypothetical protein
MMMGASMSARSLRRGLSGLAACLVCLGIALPTHGSEPVTVSDPLQHAGGPVAATDRMGNVVAVFSQTENGVSRVAGVYRPAGGAWGQLSFLETPGLEASAPTVAMNSRGRAVAAWQWRDPQGIGRIQAATMGADGSWSAPEVLSSTASHAQVPDLAVANDGSVVVAWRTSATVGVAPETVQVSQRPAGGDWGEPFTLATGAFDPHVAVDGNGNALVAWTRSGGLIEVASSAGGGSWQEPAVISDPNVPAYLRDVAMNDAGMAMAAWVDSQEEVVGVTSMAPNGLWGAPLTLSTPGSTDRLLEVALGRDGSAVAAWHRLRQDDVEERVIVAAYRAPTGAWTEPRIISEPQALALFPAVSIDRAGNALVGFRQRVELTWRPALVRRPANGTWEQPQLLAGWGEGPVFDVSPLHDGMGNEVVAWHRVTDTVDNPIEQVRVVGFDRAGPVVRLSLPGAAGLAAASFPVSWSAVDAWGTVATTQVRYREAAYSAVLGPWMTWATEHAEQAAAGVAQFSGRPGHTYCLAARASDTAGHTGSWSDERCATVPLDDRTLTRRGDWSRTTSHGSFRGTETRSRRQGDVLLLEAVRASRIALVVTRMPGAGRVRVSLSGEPLGTFRLGAPEVEKRSLVTIARFGSVHEGTLAIQVVSRTGRPVRIDGVVVARS